MINILALLLFAGGFWPIHPLKNAIIEESFSLYYDSNPFRYSSTRIDEFTKGYYPYRYPFRSIDDLFLRSSISIKGRGIPLDGRVTLNLYTMNPEKSYYSFSFFYRRQIISIGFKAIPRYLLRYYFDPDTTPRTYIPCYFGEGNVLFRVKIGEILLSLNVGYRDYNDNFEEYTGITAKFEGKFKFSWATFMSGIELYRAKSGEGKADISYWRTIAGIQKVIKFKKREVKILYRLRLRNFTTSKDDPLHIGRKDLDHYLKLTLSKKLNRRLEIGTGLSIEVRRVLRIHEALLQEIQDAKNYTRFKAFFGVTFVN